MLIRKNSSNTIILRLTQNALHASHDWLFEFTNQTTGDVKYCSAVDVSSYPESYNEFTITDNSAEDASNGTLDFSPTGSWTYKVYEMPVFSPPSLDPNLSYTIANESSLKVYSTTENPQAFFDTDENKDNAVFDD